MKSQLSTVQEIDEINSTGSNEGIEDDPHNRGPELITVRVEFGVNEKKTIKEITHADGSKTITTIVEDLIDEDEEDESTVASREEASDDLSLQLDPDVEDVKIIL